MRAIIAMFIFFLVSLSVGGYFFYKQVEHKQVVQKTIYASDQKVTFIEGWDVEQMASALEQKNIILAATFLKTEQTFSTSAFPLLSSKPENADLEGFIFPDTYRITELKPADPVKSSQEIITKALDNFSVKFTPEMEQAANARGMSVYDIVTLASIIERETGRNATTAAAKQALDQERAIVAGIFYNRLKLGMPLQSDATINYITKKNIPSASATDLQINSPYNTYLFKGLPPGPICNPSLSSLLAAVHPATTDYLYFLHKQPSGEPVYSKTFEEHVRNKEKYLK